MNLCHRPVVRRSQYCISVTMEAYKEWYKTNNSKRYKCGKRGYIQADCCENKVHIEGCACTNRRSEVTEQNTYSTLHKTSGNLIDNGFVEGKLAAFTVCVVHNDLVTHCPPLFHTLPCQSVMKGKLCLRLVTSGATRCLLQTC